MTWQLSVWQVNLKGPTHRPDSNQRPTAIIQLSPLVWPVRQKSCIETYRLGNCQLHSSVYVLCLCEVQQASLTSGGASLVAVIQNTKTGNDRTECRRRYQRKTKCTQNWLNILTWEDVCGTQYLALIERSLWLNRWSCCLLSGSLLYKDIAGGKKWFVPPLLHTAVIR